MFTVRRFAVRGASAIIRRILDGCCLLRFRSPDFVVADIPLIAPAFWHHLRTLCRCISHRELKKLFCLLYISRRFVVFKLIAFRRNVFRLTLRDSYVVIRHIFNRFCCSVCFRALVVGTAFSPGVGTSVFVSATVF